MSAVAAAILIPALLGVFVLSIVQPRRMAWLLLWSVPLLLYVSNFYFPVTVGSLPLNLARMLKDALIYAVTAGCLFRVFVGPASARVHPIPLLALAFYIGYILFLAGHSLVPLEQRLVGVRTYLQPVIVFCAVFVPFLDRPGDWDRFWRLLWWMGLVFGAVGLINYFVDPSFGVVPGLTRIYADAQDYDVLRSDRLVSVINDPNRLAMLMVLSVIAGARSWFLRRNRLVIVAGWACSLLVLLLTRSRSGLIGFMAVWGWWIVRRQRHTPTLLFGLGLIIGILLNPGVLQRFSEQHELGRGEIWRSILPYLAGSPLSLVFGHGLGLIGQFGNEFFTDSTLVVYGASGRSYNLYVVDNSYLTAFIEIGLVGVALYLAVLTTWTARRSRHSLPRQQQQADRGAIEGFLVFVLIWSLFYDSWWSYPLNLLVAAVLAMRCYVQPEGPARAAGKAAGGLAQSVLPQEGDGLMPARVTRN